MKTPIGVRRAALAGALGVSLLLPAAASADSIVHIRNGDVWLTSGDGSRSHQVTSDGAQLPYRAPSQADDGTIAASRGNEIVLLRQNGEVIRKFDPPGLVDTTSHGIDGIPVYLEISPDGSKIAYSFASYSCPVGAGCAARASTGITDSSGVTPVSKYGQVYFGDPTWISNSRVMVHGGFLHQVNTWDVGQPDKVHWWDDQDWAGQGNSTDLGDGDLSRDGRIWVGIRGYDSPPDNLYRRVIWAKTSGNPLVDVPPPLPEPVCLTGDSPGANSPTISPAGDAIAVADGEGIHVYRNVNTDQSLCGQVTGSLFVPGGSEPNWGPADINPQPRTGGGTSNGGGNNNGGGGNNNGGGGSNGGQNPIGTGSLRVTGTSLRSACKRGLKVRLSGLPAGKVTIAVKKGKKTVGKRAVKVPSTGAGTYTVKFTKSGARTASCKGKTRKVKLTVTAGKVKKSVTLRR